MKDFKNPILLRRESHLKNAIPENLELHKQNKKLLNITYVMNWTGISGGTKIILEHANKLVDLGHKLTLISHKSKPEWFPLDDRVNFIQIPKNKILGESIPPSDIIIASYYMELYECVEQKLAPVVYFEQGDSHLFDLGSVSERLYSYIKRQLETVNFVYTVSGFAQNALKEQYNKNSIVIPNGIDNKIFYYKPHKKKDKKTIALIGSEESEFKHIDNILKASEIVKQHEYDINIKWITPTMPINNKIEAIVNPKQKIIGDTLRNSDIYVCASEYEAFCLPVLEAMSCGAAVITTNNGGNMDFVQENQNALIIEKNNIKDIADKIETLLNNDELRKQLVKNGLETAKQYSWDNTINRIVQYYREIANYRVIERNKNREKNN